MQKNLERKGKKKIETQAQKIILVPVRMNTRRLKPEPTAGLKFKFENLTPCLILLPLNEVSGFGSYSFKGDDVL